MKKIIFGALLTSVLAISCVNQKQEGVLVANPDTFEQKMTEPEVQILDVRTEGEFAEGHIQDAQNIDVLQDDFKEKVATLDKNKPVMVYCKMGGRSAKAAGILKEMGFTTIVDLEGGYTAWKASGK
ncbi:rhodanese-like domain-containing protein [Flavobacterium haoranii]|uniref:Rhodanese-related sulfurtransferase n=1 Tax=Flavobacterium haoranii TaxID=683124 RepID=A0A1M6BVL8_9FLAO|nr:rhodanese-like domain-containing protein [Flavobacterium haoranii]MDK2770621.1 rhodanese-like domain-containing protein [Flavobacterium sp.]SHI52653.1 Rhodanese-related sulfurtransferase [Flavobacterium haoranii]